MVMLLSLGVTPRIARCEPSASASVTQLAAETAFRDGLRLMKEAKYLEASRRFEESQTLEPASGTLIDLAYCHRQLGKTASAWLDYRRAIVLAEATDKPAHAELARIESAKLEPVLPRLQLSIVGPAGSVSEIRLDNQLMANAAWTVPIAVDPGRHHVSALFHRRQTREVDVELAAGQLFVLELRVPDIDPNLSPAAAPIREPAAAGPAAAHRGGPPPPARRAAKSASPWIRGFAVSGGAVTALGAGLFVSARLAYDAARAHCSSDNACAEPYHGRELDAADRARVGIVIASTGLTMLGAAALLHFSLPGTRSSSARFGAVIGPGVGLGTLTEAF